VRAATIAAGAALIAVAGVHGAATNAPRLQTLRGSSAILAGTLNVQGVNGCYVVAAGTVTTADVGEDVSFAVNVWDDGEFLQGYPLTVPGDGELHEYCAIHQITAPVQQAAPGVGVYLQDEIGPIQTPPIAAIEEVTGVSPICSGPPPQCGTGAIDVPAIDRTGIVILALLLAGLATAALARRRRAA
jgi:hypothetical protein